MPGEIGILNVGAGDTKLVFDPTKPEESAHAARVVKDMIRRGFAIFVQVGENDRGPIYQRAHDFDENTHEYIIAGTPADMEDSNDEKPASPPRRRRESKKAAPRRVPASAGTSAVAVARVAGG